MARTITIDGTDRTAVTRLDSIRLQSSAFRGEVGAGSLVIDDPGSSITIDPLKAVTVVEDASTPSRIFTGYTAERGIQRGPLRAGTQRQWLITLEDLNVLLDDVLLGPGGKRPEETDYQRVSWLLGDAAMSYYSITAGQVPNTKTKTMGPEDYRGRFARDVLEDCSQRTGKNFYVYDEGSGFKLYYDKQANAGASPISISDVLADVNGSTVFAPSALDILKDPERKFDRIRLFFKGGWVERGTAPASGRRREKSVINKRIKSRKRARQHVLNLLDQTDSETVIISVTVGVPASVVGDIRAGQLIPIKLTHAGISAYTNYRIASVTIGPRPGDRGDSDVEYEVVLKMADKIRPTHVQDVGGPGGPGVPPDEKDPGPDGPGSLGGEDTTAYVLDDFTRTSDGPTIVARESTDSGGSTSHSIALPDGCDVSGRLLLVMMVWDGTNEALGADLEAASDLTEEFGDANLPNAIGGSILYRRIDGTEDGGSGYPASGASLAFSHTNPVTRLFAHAVLMDDASDLPTEGTAINVSDSLSSSAPSLTPTSGFTEWLAADPARFFQMAIADDGPITGNHTGYTTTYSDDDGTFHAYLQESAQDSAAEAPSPDLTFTGSPTIIQFLVGIRGDAGVAGWGAIPKGEGVDTEAPWEGGNNWYTSVTTGTATFALSGTDGTIEATADNASTVALLRSNSPDEGDDTYDEPWGPWTDGDGTFLFEFKTNLLGDLTDTDSNYFEVRIGDGSSRSSVRVHLGDNVAYSYGGVGARGLVLLTGTTFGTFVTKTLVADTYYLLRFDVRGPTLRAKLWAKSATEPVTWDATLAREIETGLADVRWLRLQFDGNTTNGNMILSVANIDAELAGDAKSIVTRSLPPGDGSSTTWDVEPWSGSIDVWVDGIVTPVTFDRSAGTITFDRAPASGASIRVRYNPV